MLVREAKDFLVAQTAEQAALEGVSLSDLEKRMMYFTETGECPEDPIALNDAFEAEYDSAEYEAKTSDLLHHAYRRLKKENENLSRQWNEAIRTLRNGDHYLLVLWDQGPRERAPYDSLKLFIAGMILTAFMTGIIFLEDHFGIHWKNDPREPSTWILRALFIFVLLVVGRLLVRFLGGSSADGRQD
jgi:hypothetical protein